MPFDVSLPPLKYTSGELSAFAAKASTSTPTGLQLLYHVVLPVDLWVYSTQPGMIFRESRILWALANYRSTYIPTWYVLLIRLEAEFSIFSSSHPFIMSFWTSLVTVSFLISLSFAIPGPLSRLDPSASWSGLSANLGNGYSKNPIKRDILSVELGDASSARCSYWMESMRQSGEATFNPSSSYEVFRNVKEFGAKGDGKTDDTAAIVSTLDQ